MKYSAEIIIDLPRDRVIELFDNTENMKHWQNGLVSITLLDGEAGQPGARSKLIYQMGNKKVEMIETITIRNLPEEISAIYETNGIWNEVRNYFQEISPNQTKWVSENVFKMSNLAMRIMIAAMPSAFKKQSMVYLKDFKAFAENA